MKKMSLTMFHGKAFDIVEVQGHKSFQVNIKYFSSVSRRVHQSPKLEAKTENPHRKTIIPLKGPLNIYVAATSPAAPLAPASESGFLSTPAIINHNSNSPREIKSLPPSPY